jgi:hypothetical protein
MRLNIIPHNIRGNGGSSPTKLPQSMTETVMTLEEVAVLAH